MITSKVPRMIYGGDYNPEQWPEEVWNEDVAPDAGGRREPRLARHLLLGEAGTPPREYDFGWLDRVMDLLYENGVMVDLATAPPRPHPGSPGCIPRACPSRGRASRSIPAPASTTARAAPPTGRGPSALVRRVADRYRDHPALAMWHMNNEYSVPRPVLLLRRSAPGLPARGCRTVTATSSRSTRRGGRPSGARATANGRRSCRPAARRPSQPDPAARLPPLLLGRPARVLHHGAGRAAGDHAGRARHDQLPRLPQGAGPLEVGGE